MYLQPESVDQTFQTIRELASSGSEVVFDYIYASVLRQEDVHYGEKGTAGIMARAGEQWHFGIEEGEINSFLEQYGFKLIDHRTANDLEEMYFKDPDNHIVGRINGTHCLTRAGVR
jgi:O-methyltransferase involved in polyketide biosynthesis